MKKIEDAFTDFSALSAWLDGLGLFHMDLGLERIRAVLKRMGLLRPCCLVQVVGTNGKGSTATMLAALAREHGLITGLHTSPHFVSVRERVRLNGAMLAEETWTELGNELMAHGAANLTYFEFVTALAVLAFSRAGADLAVMESGLGGRYDATTALEADMVLFTPIGLDHQAVLGATIADIAADKACAARSGKPALSAPQALEALRALRDGVLRQGALLYELNGGERQDEAVSTLRLGLAGRHQEGNARLALAAWRLLAEGILSPALGARQETTRRCGPAKGLEARALEKAWFPGRLHFIPPSATEAAAAREGGGKGPFAACPLGRPPLLLDGAHNSHGLAALGKALACTGVAPAALIFSCLEDKDLDVLAPLLRSLATGPIFVPPIADNSRAADPRALVAAIGLNARPAASLSEALDMAARHMVERLPEAFVQNEARNPLLVCGSLYLLGELYALFPEFLDSGPG